MSITKILCSDAFISVNKHLIKEVGLEGAVIIGELAYQYETYKKTNQLTDDGYFFSTIENIQEKTSIKEKRQRIVINELKSRGILDTCKRGLPSKRYIKINEMALIKLLLGDGYSSASQTELETPPEATNNNIYNNNINNKYNEQLKLIEEEKKEAVPGEQLTKVEKTFFNHYNTLENLPKCMSYHKDRKKQLNMLIKKYGIDSILDYLTKLNERPYIVTSREMKKSYLGFDMVLRETTYAKCVEGGYMNICEGYTGEYKLDSDQSKIKTTPTYQVSEFQGLTLD